MYFNFTRALIMSHMMLQKLLILALTLGSHSLFALEGNSIRNTTFETGEFVTSATVTELLED